MAKQDRTEQRQMIMADYKVLDFSTPEGRQVGLIYTNLLQASLMEDMLEAMGNVVGQLDQLNQQIREL